MSKSESVRLYKVRKLISELASKEGRGTELVSLYVPPKKPIHEVIANLRDEWGTAGNIKSDTTRNHVQDALVKTMQRLKLYKDTPENGLVIFCGALGDNPGNEVVNIWEIQPPKQVHAYMYQCLSPDAEVLLEDGRLATMEELESGWPAENVVTYDFEKRRLVGSSVQRYVRTSAGPRRSYELVVESGRRVIATEDHPFWTPRGWVRLGAIKPGDFVGLLPVADLDAGQSPDRDKSRVVVDEASLRQSPNAPEDIGLVVSKLTKLGLLPLREDNPKLPIVARLLGHLFSEGSLIVEKGNGQSVYFTIDCLLENGADVNEVKRDLAWLGFESRASRRAQRIAELDDKAEGTVKAIHLKVEDSTLCTLLGALGAPVGSRSKDEAVIPGWLVASPRPVKKEFLASYLGGHGVPPTFLKSDLIGGARLSFHRKGENKTAGLTEQLTSMFAEFGVTIDRVSCNPDHTGNGVEIVVCFTSSEENVLRLCHGIGFAYCSEKRNRAALAGEYLRIKSRVRAETAWKTSRTRNLSPAGARQTRTGELLAPAQTTVGTLSTAPQLPTFEKWKKLATNGPDDPLLWEAVASVSSARLSDVRDLTVEESNHSFVANGFLVHNCDDHFHLEWLKDMLREEKVFGLLVIDSSESAIGILSGDRLEIPDDMTSGISGKTRKGGQSSRRYERGREMELTYFYHRVADHAVKILLEDAKVTGLIVGGPGPTKEAFLKSELLNYQLRQKIVAVIDTSYSGREGIRELVERASDVLQGVRLVEEKKFVQKFLGEVNRQGGLAVYGLPRVMEALQKANAEVVLVSDDLDTVSITAQCRKCNTIKEGVAQTRNKVQKIQEMISQPCVNCGGSEYDLSEKDLVDVLEEMAFQVGSKVEMISSGTEEGNMFKSFGGVGAILRYRPS
ncbi:MAG TPA: peptide chain release factor aRF-1 [Nitrososphaerales archaeon]|nr:peptide chain release factor aRF-1 [Nitrososphaerales archaeon]